MQQPSQLPPPAAQTTQAAASPATTPATNPPAPPSPAVDTPPPVAATAASSNDTASWVNEPTVIYPSHAPVASKPPAVKTTTVEHFVETIPRWVWWVGVAFPVFLVVLGWSVRKQARLAGEREQMERQQRILEMQQRNLRVASEQLRHQATNDPLTGILNRRAFADELRKLLEHLSRFGRPLDLIVFDLDHFKQINDQQGHLAGDIALKLVAGVVHQHLNSDDLFGRFGGDEFLIGCADRSPGETAALADTIRTAVVAVSATSTPPLPGLSLSLGVARAVRGAGYHLEDLFARADTALYAAKRGGRNRVVVASDDLPAPPVAETVTRQLA